MAVAGKMAAARFNTPEHVIFDHHVVCLAGDYHCDGLARPDEQRIRRLCLLLFVH